MQQAAAADPGSLEGGPGADMQGRSAAWMLTACRGGKPESRVAHCMRGTEQGCMTAHALQEAGRGMLWGSPHSLDVPTAGACWLASLGKAQHPGP